MSAPPAPPAPERPGLGVRLMGRPRPMPAVVGAFWIALGIWALSAGRLGLGTGQLVLGAAMVGWNGYGLLRARRTVRQPVPPTTG